MVNLIYRQFSIVAGLVCLNLVTASMMMKVAHQNRQMYKEIESLHEQRDQLETRRGQLLLELSSLAAHGRIERNAREKLNMYPPPSGDILTMAID